MEGEMFHKRGTALKIQPILHMQLMIIQVVAKNSGIYFHYIFYLSSAVGNAVPA